MEREFSEAWYKGVENAKEKARKLLHQVIAVNQATSIVVGKLEAAEIDKLAPGHHAACKLTMTKINKYGTGSKYQTRTDDMGVFFVNKPNMIMTMEELESNNPDIFEEVHINIKKGVWDGSKAN